MSPKQTAPAPEGAELTADALDVPEDVAEPDDSPAEDQAEDAQTDPEGQRDSDATDNAPEAVVAPERSQSFRDQVNAEFAERDREREEEQQRCKDRYLRMLHDIPKDQSMDPSTLDGLISAAFDAGVSKELMLEHLGVFERYRDLAQVLYETSMAQRSREMGEAHAAMKALEKRHKKEYTEARRRVSEAMGLSTHVSFVMSKID